MRKATARAPRSANSWSWLQPTAPLFDVAQPSPCCRVVSCKASTSSYSQAQERPRCVWLWLLPRGAPLVVVHVTGRLLCPLASACNQVTGFYASVFTTLYFVADMTSGAIVKASMRCPRGALWCGDTRVTVCVCVLQSYNYTATGAMEPSGCAIKLVVDSGVVVTCDNFYANNLPSFIPFDDSRWQNGGFGSFASLA